ncbi:MAG: Ig-like domain-containing protein [Mollicutes bacterium]|nr:Ig-like domain-containing protein [Mollicutes bacterium]
MKKELRATLLVLSSIALIGCKPTSSESSTEEDTNTSKETTTTETVTESSSTVEEKTISFNDAIKQLTGLYRSNEGDFASKEIAIETSNRDNKTITKKTTTREIYNDLSGYGQTNIYKTDLVNNKEEYLFDTINQRVAYKSDKIREDNNNVGLYDLQYVAEISSNFPLRDSSTSRKFVVANKDIATSNNLAEGSYVLEAGKGLSSTLDCSYKAATYIENNLMNNYATQTGVETFVVASTEEGNKYSTSLSYETTDDGMTTKIEESCVFVINHSRLTSLKYETITSDYRSEEDKSIKKDSFEAVIEYNDRVSPAENAFDPTLYFLSEIKEAKFVDTFGNDVDATRLDKDKNQYLRAYPVTYIPSTAVDFDLKTLVPTETSDKTIASIDEKTGIIEPKKEGTVKITFTYFGKGEDGVWDNKTIDLDLTIKPSKPTSIYVDQFAIPNNIVPLGDTLSFEAKLFPSGVDQDIEVSSANPEIISATFDATTSKVNVTGVAEGKTSITVKSISHPEISKTLNLECQVKIDLEWFNANVVGHTFRCDKAGYEGRTLTFNENGAGVCIDIYGSTTDTYTFKYAYIADAQLSLTNWNSNACGYSTDTNDYESETPENATIFVSNGKPTLKLYRPIAYNYHTFTRID